MKISSISGLTYRVRDLDMAVGFYESLGFRIGKRDDEQATCYVNWFWVRSGRQPARVLREVANSAA